MLFAHDRLAVLRRELLELERERSAGREDWRAGGTVV